MDIETQLRELLLPVFGLESIDKISMDASLVKDIGADSLDFVEITYLIERDFGVMLKANELVVAGARVNADNLFEEGKLTYEGASILKSHFPDNNSRFKAGMTKADLFQSITVCDLANIIKKRIIEREQQC